MTRPLRIELVDGLHHVSHRALPHRELFADDRERRVFLSEVRGGVIRRRWRCVAYCLMDTHYHLLVQTPVPNLSLGMRDLNSAYARSYLARRGIGGPVFHGRFSSQLVQDNAYLLAVGRYIALNPVRAGMVARAEDWSWSSFGALARGDLPAFVDETPLLRLLDEDDARARRHFAAVVAEGQGLPPYDPDAPIAGSTAFVRRHAPAAPPDRPVGQAAWRQARPSLEDLLREHSRHKAIQLARQTHRYGLQEIADAVGCNERTIRRWLKMSDAGT